MAIITPIVRSINQGIIISEESLLPSDIPDLGLWLDGDDEPTITKSANAVSQWDDKSGNGRNATQATGAAQPIYTVGGMNGLPILRFDGVDDLLSYDGTFLVGTDYTVTVVEQRRSSVSNNFAFGGTTAFLNRNLHAGWLNSSNIRHAQFGTGYDMSVPAFTVPIPTYHTYTHNSVSGKVTYENGTQLGSSANTDDLAIYAGAAICGFLTTVFATLDIGEVIIYDRTLSDEERGKLNQYLSLKWSI